MLDPGQIVARHSPIVWQTALRLLGNEPDAADCFQETFLSAMDAARREHIINWPGLLQRIATARALDILRKRLLARKRHPAGNDLSSVPATEPEPLDQLQNNELADSLAHALAQLPPQQAHAYCLRHLNDFSYQQIADELGISIDAVGTDLHRARARLRQLLPSLNEANRGAP